MKVFVTGVSGQLGHDVVNELAKRKIEVLASDIGDSYTGLLDGSAVTKARYAKLDITDEPAVASLLNMEKPDAIIHCAAWTAVDAAEDEENKAKVFAINENGTKNIAKICKNIDAKMLYISTDYVFSGEGEKPWEADCPDFAPQCVYGASKLAGEIAVRENLDKYFIVRISWVFGKNGKNFVRTMLGLGDKLEKLTVVNDQIGTPTYTKDLAVLLCDMIESEKYGTYNASNEGGYISWYDFACEIMKVGKKNAKVLPVTTAEYGASKAKRPLNSRMDKSKLYEAGFKALPSWQDALARYINEEI